MGLSYRALTNPTIILTFTKFIHHIKYIEIGSYIEAAEAKERLLQEKGQSPQG